MDGVYRMFTIKLTSPVPHRSPELVLKRRLAFPSWPELVAANEMYRKLGFVRRETNAYRMKR